MSIDPIRYRHEYQNHVFLAKDSLQTIRATPSPEFSPDSHAQLAFDPYIGRRLQMATPIRVITPPSFQETCKFFGYFLDGLYEIGLLETVDQITTWEVRFLTLSALLILFIYMLIDSWPPPILVTRTPFTRAILKIADADDLLRWSPDPR